MRSVIDTILSDFQQRELPALVRRDAPFPEMEGKASVVTGMRRSGKTWYCYQRIADLLASGVDRSQVLYLNFEDDRFIDFSLRDFQTLLDVFFARWPQNKSRRCYFFFDEIQTVDKWERFVRRLLDTENVGVALTGSSSKMLATDIATGLRGRTRVRELSPFSFREFLSATGAFSEVPDHPGSRDAAKLRHALAAYLSVGGFPETLRVDPSVRREIVQGYVETVLFKDVVERHKVSNVLALRHLIAAVLGAPGQVFSVNKFFNTLKSKGIPCTKNALYDYLGHLEDAHFLHRLPFHSPSVRVRQVNPEKVYANDTALHGLLLAGEDRSVGQLLETAVFLQLRREQLTLSYLHARDGHEIDFVATDEATGDTRLIQVCADLSNRETLARELRPFAALPPEFADAEKLIVTLDDERDFDNGVRAVPAWRFLLGTRKGGTP